MKILRWLLFSFLGFGIQSRAYSIEGSGVIIYSASGLGDEFAEAVIFKEYKNFGATATIGDIQGKRFQTAAKNLKEIVHFPNPAVGSQAVLKTAENLEKLAPKYRLATAVLQNLATTLRTEAAAVPALPSAPAGVVKRTITDSRGRVYTGVSVIGGDPDGLRITHTNGVAKIGYEDLTPELRKEFGLVPPPPNPQKSKDLTRASELEATGKLGEAFELYSRNEQIDARRRVAGLLALEKEKLRNFIEANEYFEISGDTEGARRTAEPMREQIASYDTVEALLGKEDFESAKQIYAAYNDQEKLQELSLRIAKLEMERLRLKPQEVFAVNAEAAARFAEDQGIPVDRAKIRELQKLRFLNNILSSDSKLKIVFINLLGSTERHVLEQINFEFEGTTVNGATLHDQIQGDLTKMESGEMSPAERQRFEKYLRNIADKLTDISDPRAHEMNEAMINRILEFDPLLEEDLGTSLGIKTYIGAVRSSAIDHGTLNAIEFSIAKVNEDFQAGLKIDRNTIQRMGGVPDFLMTVCEYGVFTAYQSQDVAGSIKRLEAVAAKEADRLRLVEAQREEFIRTEARYMSNTVNDLVGGARRYNEQTFEDLVGIFATFEQSLALKRFKYEVIKDLKQSR